MSEAYRVLARKYRPQTFEDLVGQEVLVKTLSNAIARNRVHHAILLTGIRGIGKTTTARLIARALNCLGADGNGGATIQPCGVCANCIAIAESRHPDVLEMDAASHTGVDDIRSIIETVRYAPTSARYKVYIVDEVHMLSKNAFNALLKTLEEPPPHVIFLFATTELRKIPVTILSRCQRFDLKRLETAELMAHLGRVAAKESIAVEEEALRLIAGSAEGSVRDGLSLLDQAIAHNLAEEGETSVSAQAVRDMLGLAGHAAMLDLIDHLFAGRIAEALSHYSDMLKAGADPVLLLQDLLQVVHYLTRLKIAGGLEGDALHYTAEDRARAGEMAKTLSMMALTRSWQMLLKGLQDAKLAPQPAAAAEMALIRLAYAADLPSPAELADKPETGGDTAPRAPNTSGHTATVPRPTATISAAHGGSGPAPAALLAEMDAPVAYQAMQPVAQPAMPQPQSFAEIVAMFAEHKELVLHGYLRQAARLVSLQPGRLELNMDDTVPADAIQRIGKVLNDWTGSRWMVMLSREQGQPTLVEAERNALQQKINNAEQDPVIQQIMRAFPGAEISHISEE